MKTQQNKIIGTQSSFSTNFGGQLSFILSFLFLSASTAATYIFTTPTCTTTTLTLNPCALNADFQHFILRFNKNFITLWIPLKEGIGESRGDRGWKRGWRQGEFVDNSNICQVPTNFLIGFIWNFLALSYRLFKAFRLSPLKEPIIPNSQCQWQC
jgi:hypothetical protein